MVNQNIGKWKRKQMLNSEKCSEPEYREIGKKTDDEEKIFVPLAHKHGLEL